MNGTIITQTGLNFIANAHESGPIIAIKYCLPIYDMRYDSSVLNTFNTPLVYSATLSAISACTEPVGEVIWKLSGTDKYSLSQNCIVSAGSTSVSGTNILVANSTQDGMGVGMNLMNSVPLSNVYSGTNLYPPSITQAYWVIENTTTFEEVIGVNDKSSTNRARYWPITDYYPVIDDTGTIRGSFKAHLNSSVGRVKFNRLALYAVSIGEDGQENMANPPVYFADAFISEVCVKSDLLQEGYDDLLIDVQLNLSQTTDPYNTIFFGTSASQWVSTVSGVYYSNRVGIGSYAGSTDIPQASLHVRPVDSASVIRIDSHTTPNTNFATLNVDANNVCVTSALGVSASTYYGLSAGNPSNPFQSIESLSETTVNLKTNTINSNTSSDIYIMKDLIPITPNYQSIGNVANPMGFVIGNTVSATYLSATSASISNLAGRNNSSIILHNDIIPNVGNIGSLGSVGTPMGYVISQVGSFSNLSATNSFFTNVKIGTHVEQMADWYTASYITYYSNVDPASVVPNLNAPLGGTTGRSRYNIVNKMCNMEFSLDYNGIATTYWIIVKLNDSTLTGYDRVFNGILKTLNPSYVPLFVGNFRQCTVTYIATYNAFYICVPSPTTGVAVPFPETPTGSIYFRTSFELAS